ncbi:glycogen debranching N-terminal domain-containing protein [Methanocella sp. MCL-LM]|uniref:amylo-alpha-1,6-glucosidase n=1 Tax=Methanocella sp. MCL-LM TaxID=3412035 RepID=UPI003C7089AC
MPVNENSGEPPATDPYKRHTQSTNITNELVIRQDNLTFVTLDNGEIPIGGNYGYGLYFKDCRFLSGYLLKIMGMSPTPILSNDERGYQSLVVMTNPEFLDCKGDTIDKETILISRNTVIPGCILETLTVENYNPVNVTLDILMEFDADFTDIFTIRGITGPAGGTILPVGYSGGEMRLSCAGKDGHLRETIISFEPAPRIVNGKSCTFQLSLRPHETRAIKVQIFVSDTAPGQPGLKEPVDVGQQMNKILRSYIAAVECCNNIPTSNNIFNSIMERSLADLTMMRMSQYGHTYHSAGVPWYDALFGRDSLISALQLLPYGTEPARSTLLLNAKYQGRKYDDWTEEEPGKILHELRVGEMANLNLIPQRPYYGTVDATPLFLILLAEYIDWTGDTGMLKRLESNVDAALRWIADCGDIGGRGFTSYAVKSDLGIYNQGWKDSFDSVSRSDGTLAKKPIALAEVQGYVYMAKKRLSPLFKLIDRHDDANRLNREADDLKERFNREFWMGDRTYFAQALDAEGICDVISSNPAQCLWTGILDSGYVKPFVARLFESDMFTEWGIRTLSSSEKRYNPLGYHNGTIWPHDNSIIAMGLRKYGFVNELSVVFTGMYEAARMFTNYRLPECFGGFPRSKYSLPVKYPVACSPQAWASGAIPQMLTACLGLVPDALHNRLTLNKPHLPSWLNKVQFNNIRVGDTLISLDFRRIEDKTMVNVARKEGDLNVLIEY